MKDKVEREAWMALHDPFLFSSFGDDSQSLKPGLKKSLANWSATPADLAFWLPKGTEPEKEILGVFPHMHTYGRKMRMTIDRGDEKDAQCVADVHRWDFNWQRMYYFKDAIKFGPKDTLRTVCTYDTSSKTKPLYPGFGTDDEMCLMGLYITTVAK